MGIRSEIAAAYDDGMTVDEIAAEMGCKTRTVKRLLAESGIKGALCADDKFMIALMGPIFQGSNRDIAEVMGCNRWRVNRLRRQMEMTI